MGDTVEKTASPNSRQFGESIDIPDHLIKGLVRNFLENGTRVQIDHFHLPVYPADRDDIAFVLCADNGKATHLITYDRHLREIGGYYPFKVCGPTDFLTDLRRALETA